MKNVLLVLLGAAIAAIVLADKKKRPLAERVTSDDNVIKFPSVK